MISRTYIPVPFLEKKGLPYLTMVTDVQGNGDYTRLTFSDSSDSNQTCRFGVEEFDALKHYLGGFRADDLLGEIVEVQDSESGFYSLARIVRE